VAKAAKEKTGESRTESGNPDIEWRCITCSTTAPPSASGYMSLIKHKCTGTKQIRLIAIETGEELALNLRQAQAAGLVRKLKPEEGSGEKGDSSRGGFEINLAVNIRLPGSGKGG
jgi:hypothetical protein